MRTGTVTWFSPAKGFGLIALDEGGREVFAHYSEINMDGCQSLREGQRVVFEELHSPYGEQASNIRSLIECM